MQLYRQMACVAVLLIDGCGLGAVGGDSTPQTPGPAAPDTTPPLVISGQPTGVLPAATTQVTMSVATSEPATCKWGSSDSSTYAGLTDTFTTTGGTAHDTMLSGLTDGASYTRYVRCLDSAGNASSNSYVVDFRVATAPPAGAVADPTQLPVAAGQSPAAGTYGRALSAGQTYVDPNSGVTVLRLTDASTPRSNGGIVHGYSEGGPNISQPWVGTNGATYYTVRVSDDLVDVRPDTLQMSNWRSHPGWGEIGFAFSLDPATPRIAYLVDNNNSELVQRYDTATNQFANTANWPWSVQAAGQYTVWLQNSVNDAWFVAMHNSNALILAFEPSSGTERSLTQARAGVSIDEPHIDRELPYVYISQNDAFPNLVWSLVDDTLRPPNDPDGVMEDDHVSPLRGAVVGMSNWQRYTFFYYDVVADEVVEFADSYDLRGITGDWHQAGQWVFGNEPGIAQWFTIDSCCGAQTNVALRQGMIGFVRPAPYSVRIVAAHDSIVDSYDEFPKTTLSPDGKLVMWSSDMNNSGRTDVFVARMPVTSP